MTPLNSPLPPDWSARLSRQYTAWGALHTARRMRDRCAPGTPERTEWDFICKACLRESNRLDRIAARQRRKADREAEAHNAAMHARLDWLNEQGIDPADWLSGAAR